MKRNKDIYYRRWCEDIQEFEYLCRGCKTWNLSDMYDNIHERVCHDCKAEGYEPTVLLPRCKGCGEIMPHHGHRYGSKYCIGCQNERNLERNRKSREDMKVKRQNTKRQCIECFEFKLPKEFAKRARICTSCKRKIARNKRKLNNF